MTAEKKSISINWEEN